MALKLYRSLTKCSKLKVKNFWGLIPTLVELQGENWVGRGGGFQPPILNRINLKSVNWLYINTEKSPPDIGLRECNASNLPKTWIE